jgi:hypothetical protein
MKHPRPKAWQHIRVLNKLTLAAGLVALASAPGAWASTAEMQDSYLVYRAGDGETNVVTVVHRDDGLITVTDTGAIIQATNGCVSKDVHVAECGQPSLPEFGDLHHHVVALGDLNDSAEVFGLEQNLLTDYSISGDVGDDILSGGNERDFLDGGDGTDRLDGGGGDDTLIGGTGRDLTRGGFGIDTTSYLDRTAPLRVEIGDGPGDGEPGEGDDVQTENVAGGAGDDVLIGNLVGNKLEGAAGQDVLVGGKGADELVGEDRYGSGEAASGDTLRCGSDLDTAVLVGPDLPTIKCEQLAHDTSLRIGLAALDRKGPRRLHVTLQRLDTDSRSAIAEAHIPRLGQSRAAVTIAGGGEGVVEVLVSRAGRRWLRRHPRRRVRLNASAHDPDFPDNPVEVRLRVRVPES